MSVTIEEVLYTRIGTTSTACVGTEDGSKYAVSTSKSGEITILPSVPIDGICCTVTMIGKYAFFQCKGVTKITLPNTVTTLKFGCFENLYLTEPLILPSSVTTVESCFINSWYSHSLVFCGTKEPEMIKISTNTYWISSYFTGSVIVPMNYEKGTFCLKNATKSLTTGCQATIVKVQRIFTCFRRLNKYPLSSFILTCLLIS